MVLSNRLPSRQWENMPNICPILGTHWWHWFWVGNISENIIDSNCMANRNACIISTRCNVTAAFTSVYGNSGWQILHHNMKQGWTLWTDAYIGCMLEERNPPVFLFTIKSCLCLSGACIFTASSFPFQSMEVPLHDVTVGMWCLLCCEHS